MCIHLSIRIIRHIYAYMLIRSRTTNVPRPRKPVVSRPARHSVLLPGTDPLLPVQIRAGGSDQEPVLRDT